LLLLVPMRLEYFLGIPIYDVTAFIENNGKNYIFNQYWKVYHNPQKTKKFLPPMIKQKLK
jgi:hypothetical protein